MFDDIALRTSFEERRTLESVSNEMKKRAGHAQRRARISRENKNIRRLILSMESVHNTSRPKDQAFIFHEFKKILKEIE